MPSRFESYHPARRFPRRKLDVQVALLQGHLFSFERATEVSEGGLLLKISRALEVGQRLEIRFFLPNGTFVSMKAEVAYVLNPNELEKFAGLRFVDPTEDGLKSIRAFVDEGR